MQAMIFAAATQASSLAAIQWVNAIVVLIGVPAAVAGLIAIGRKLETLDSLKQDIHEDVKPDLKDVRERFAALEGKAAGLFNSKSPISLTDKGLRALKASGLKAYIDQHKQALIRECSQKNGMDTPYDVQEAAMKLFQKYEFPKDIDDGVKTYAFQNGSSVDSIRFLAGIYFRDLCLREHSFNLGDLDK